MIIIEFIAIAFWAILGLIFWIPLLVRIIAGFCGTLIFNMVINNPEAIHKSKISLDLAVSFYSRGFQTIKSALESTYFKNDTLIAQSNNNSNTEDGINNSEGALAKDEFNVLSFVAQLLWTIIFWGLTLFSLFGPSIFGIKN